MEKITYGAPRYMDWVAQLKVGAATVRIHFTGGALTAYGVTPAEYTTTNPVIQRVIEQSQYYKEGRIVKLRSTTVTEPKGAGRPKKATPKPQTPAHTPAVEQTEAVEQTPVFTENEPPRPTEVETPAEETPTEGLKEVEVSCLQDAQDYLQQNFGISSYKVRSKAAAQRAAAEHGVMFTGAGFTPAEGEASTAEDSEE